MKILMLVHRFPYPPVQGDSIRSWGELEYLSSRHEVWLACVDRAVPRTLHMQRARQCCRDVVVTVRPSWACLLRGGLHLLGGRSLSEGYFYDSRLARVVRRWDQQVGFDAVLTFSPVMAMYAALVSAKRRVLDMNDVESCKWRSYARRSWPPPRWLYAWEARRLPRAEAAWIRAHDVTLLVNELERGKVPDSLAHHTAVVRTGVDHGQYTPGQSGAAFRELPPAPVVGMLGSMSYAPNVRAVNWFGRYVWPPVKAKLPDARWLIVGRRPARSVRRWARRPDVVVTGFVEDVRPQLAVMRVFACAPREQIGVQTKLIEALAAGRPAVVTPQAAAGIDYDDPPPFAIAGSPAEFADAVVRLLRDDAQARALARRARTVARENYDRADQVRRIECLLAGGTAEPGPVESAVPSPAGAAALDTPSEVLRI